MNAEQVQQTLNSFSFRGDTIPEYMHPGIVDYFANGVLPGDFLTAVLENDLKEAVISADDNNIQLLPVYVSFLRNCVPAISWGNPKRVREWVAEHRPSINPSA